MHTEIESAVSFLITTLSHKLANTSEETLESLRKKLTELLLKRFENHWYPEKPMKGSAFRCININIDDGSVDAVLVQAAEECGISKQSLIGAFNKGLALWVDPNDVSCRLGKGAIFPISRKIVEKKAIATSSTVTGTTNPQRRPQMRPGSVSPPSFKTVPYSNSAQYSKPRSVSPPSFMTVPYSTKQHQSRPRSTTPPGFSSMDAGQMYQSLSSKRNYSAENLYKVWDSIPNTSVATTSTAHYQTASSNFPTRAYKQNDSFSFNQYSSYYNSGSLWKKNNFTSSTKQHKQPWVDDEVYNKYHWSRNERSTVSSGNTYGYSNMSTYGYSPARYAQEVC